MFEKPSEIKNPSEKKESKLVNTIEMETLNAQYRIYYDSHESIVDPQLLEDCDGLIMEMIADYDDSQKAGKVFNELSRSEQFSKLFQIAAKKNKSVYFVDMQMEGKNLDEEENNLMKKMAIEYLAATGLALYALSDLAKNKKMNRRDFLKLGLKTTAAAYLATPLAQELAFIASLNKDKLPDEQSASRKIEKGLNRINKVIHPELNTVIVDVRNDLMAQKAEMVARLFQQKTGKKPKFALVVGAHHLGIEQALKDSEPNRVGRLKKTLGTELSQNASIAKIEFIPGKDAIYYDAKIIKDMALE